MRQDFDDAEVAGYWEKAVASCYNAKNEALAPDSRFLLAFTALAALHGWIDSRRPSVSVLLAPVEA